VTLANYATAAAVFAYGDVQTPTVAQTAVMNTVIPAVSRAVDTWLNQTFAQQSYSAVVYRAQIDPDGILQVWLPCPDASAFTAMAWKLGTSMTWNVLAVTATTTYEIEPSDSGARLRVLSPTLLAYRGQRVQMRLSYTGGWADANIPQDFAWYAQRLCWVEFKKRETAEVGKTAIPEMGIVIVPQAWPADVKAGLSSYRRVVLT
jgi:predicted membrane-bound mannosyltransferase